MKDLSEIRNSEGDQNKIVEFIIGALRPDKVTLHDGFLELISGYLGYTTIRIYYSGAINISGSQPKGYPFPNQFEIVDFIRSMGYEPLNVIHHD